MRLPPVAARTRSSLAGPLLICLAATAGSAQISYQDCDDLAAIQFRKVTVASGGIQEPVKMAFLPDGRFLFVERRGPVKLVKPGSATPTAAWTKEVFWERSTRGAKIEDGTLGIAVDPSFASNHWLYILYSPLDKDVNRVSRFTMDEDRIDTASEKIILEYAVQRDYCCHTGGGMGWDAEGNLYLATGDNTASDDQYAPINETAGKSHLDAQRSAGNTNDLRGKLIRIKPRPLPESPSPGPTPGPGSTYDIPAGNLKDAFASLWPDASERDKVRPEIYSMGHRNPYTLFVDRYRGWAHIGEVGPDASMAMAGKGPAKHEEFNLVKRAGNFGWPYFISNNIAYNDWDYVANATGPAFDPASPVNKSVNNTGAQKLPPAVGSVLSREAGRPGKSVNGVERFTAFVGSSAIGGPVYYYDGRNTAPYKLPPHFDRKWFMTDHEAGNLNVATLSADGDSVTDVAKVPLPNGAGINAHFDHPVGMEMGPDGMLYVIEYAAGNFQYTANTKISRIEYTGSCKPATPVPPDTPVAAGAPVRPKARLMALVDGGRALRLPAGVAGFSLHDLKGARIWEYRRGSTGAEEIVPLPANLPRGVLFGSAFRP